MRFLFCLLVLLVAGCGGGGGSSGGGETPPQRDVVVYVPGGGWISVADPSEVPPDIASLPRLAAEAGYDYVQLDYPVGECCLAASIISKLSTDLAALQNSHRKVFVVASSAGTTPIARILQLRPELVDAYVGLCGIYDITTTPDEFQRLYGRRYTNDLYADSPIFFGVPTKPMLLWHSTGDTIVTYTQSTAFSDADTHVVFDPGLDHCLRIWDTNAALPTMQWLAQQ